MRMMASLLLASLGVPMLAQGQDFLRSKHGTENTYQRGDINALDYRRVGLFKHTRLLSRLDTLSMFGF